MRTLSKKTQYSLRALYALTRKFGQGPVLIAKLSQEEKIPQQFLEQILLNLKQHGLVESKKGKGGGYNLAKDPSTVTLGSVIRSMEGPLAPLPCASETAYRKCDECVDDRFCETKIIMRQVRDATAGILDNTTLAQICKRSDTARAEVEPPEIMYHI